MGMTHLLMGTFGQDLTQAEGSCMSCAFQALPMARQQVLLRQSVILGLGSLCKFFEESNVLGVLLCM